MARKYGGFTGNPSASEPSKAAAIGSWQSPTEASRLRALNEWPVGIPSELVNSNTGEYVYAVTSGAAYDLVDTGSYLIASGQEISRTTYSTLFSTLGVAYGSGDNSTTFNIPSCEAPYIYIKPSIPASSLNFSTASGQGVLPSHSHTFDQTTGEVGGTGQGGGPGTRFGGFVNNFQSRLQGRYEGNRGCTMEMVPLICTGDVKAPIGVVAPMLIPDITKVATALPVNCVVCSGQELNRVTYSSLFQKVGTTFGVGDGSNTFNVPDLRGLFLSAPVHDIVEPSGYAQPSGFVPHAIAAHTHLMETYSFGGPGLYTSGPLNSANYQPPDSSVSTVGAALESRPSNLSCVFILVVE